MSYSPTPCPGDFLHVAPAGVLRGGGLPHLHPKQLQAGHVPRVSEQDPGTLRGLGPPGIEMRPCHNKMTSCPPDLRRDGVQHS